ncbi:GspH/FimT family pseudopilin [Microbulbifer agarilyticus]|uniref:GspH/FimT family pseudopilin n=1 Tax=Microbulbifer agarilyticus TaxID=260552 RepID=UPI001C977571|nr:GspH/FimT family pseudopilin [Microbulbifer agarilyticus]MBY6191835.1 GspH/FimT family pseudopilin [Microbulbifer agarilyticus]
MGFKQQGLTLIELLVTMTVFAVVVGIAIPSFNSMVQNTRSATLGEEILGALQYARSEAIKRGERVTLCGSSDGTDCDGGWADNWIVVVDTAATDDAASPIVANSAAVLRFWEAPGNGATVTATQGGSSPSFVRFTRQGTLGLSGTGEVTLNTSFNGCSSNSARQITVGAAGMLSTKRSTSGCS